VTIKFNQLVKSVFVKGTIAGVITLGISKIFLFFIKLIVARLGANNLGIYYLFTSVFTSLATLTALGIPMSAGRYVSLYSAKKQTDKIYQIINGAVTLIVITGLFISLLLYLFPKPLFNLLNIPLVLIGYKWIGIILTAELILLLLKQIFFGLLKITLGYSLDNIEAIIRFSGIFILVSLYHQGINGALFGYSIGPIITLIIGITIFKYTTKTFTLRPKISRELFSYTWPVSISEILTALITTIPLIILKNTHGQIAVGYYAAAIAIASLLHLLPQIILPIFFPVINHCYGDNQSIIPTYRKTIIFLVSFLIPATLAVYIFSNFIINRLFGVGFLPAVNILKILAPAYSIYAVVVWPNRQILDMAGKTKSNLLLTIIRVILIILFTYLLIPKFGGRGLALALLIGWGTEGILCLYIILKNTNLLSNSFVD
jgi:O-antigen/teichoic acid export membrane protein